MTDFKKKNNYSDESIQVLEGLQAVRKRPGMYIGSTNIDGLHHLVWELFDNAIDEAIAGFASEITIQLCSDNSVIVKDNGRGIPVGINKTTKLTTVDTVFTVLHAGGKFGSDSAYQVSGGLHGVGSSVVNALSSQLEVFVCRDNKKYHSKYINGGQIDQALKVVGKTTETGTMVQFWPDKTIFKQTEFKKSVIIERLQEASFLFANLKINFIDQNNNIITFKNTKGLTGFIEFMNESKKPLSSICEFQGEFETILVNVAFQWTHESSDTLISFANSVKTREGGAHEQGLKQALLDCLTDFARKNKMIKPTEDFEINDLLEGFVGVVAVSVPEKLIIYEGQTKAKLFTQEAKQAVYKIMINQFSAWLVDHSKDAKNIVEKILEAKKARLAAKKAREEVKKLRSTKTSKLLAGKLVPPQSKKPDRNEIFLVEGDSAGGSAKTCRNKVFQGILPLKGKIINVEKAKLIDLLNNDEISSIITSLGIGFGKEVNLKTLNYNKIIIMTDADNDGAHIQSLLLTLFYRYMRPLIENGHVYLANPPLYQLSVNSKTKDNSYYAWSEIELAKLKKEHPTAKLRRFKGLGEMQADQLWDTTMNPETRQLIKVTINDLSLAERRISTLMGDDVSSRKKWINENIDFVQNDEMSE